MTSDHEQQQHSVAVYTSQLRACHRHSHVSSTGRGQVSSVVIAGTSSGPLVLVVQHVVLVLHLGF